MHKTFNYLESIFGVILLTITLNLFFIPLNIDIGGTSGLAVVAKELFSIDTTLFIAIFYALMIVLNLIVFGMKDTKNLLLFSILYPLFTKIFSGISEIVVIDYESSKLTIFLFAAVLSGIGNGLIYKNGFITGGTDVIKKIVAKGFHISMGMAIRIVDSLIVLIGGYLFGLTSIIYAIIIIYISSKIADKIILGISVDKTFYVITDKEEEVRNFIINELNSNVTQLEAYGFSNDKKHMLMSVINTKKYIKLKEQIMKIDNNAFIIIFDSYHTYHGGIKSGIN